MSWKVDYEKQVEKQVAADLGSGLLSTEDVRAIKKWVDDVERNGLEAAQKNPNWRDHALFGEWAGYRAISFSIAGRVIYRVVDQKLIVIVVRVTPVHDYKK